MGAKTFVNNTGNAVIIQLLVRQGSDPAHLLNAQFLTVAAGGSVHYSYGGDDVPFLNGLGVSSNANGNLMQSFQYVTSRGSDVDNLLNTKSNISIAQSDESLIITSSN